MIKALGEGYELLTDSKKILSLQKNTETADLANR